MGRIRRKAVPAPLAGDPPSLVSVPAEFNHWNQLNINTRLLSFTTYFWVITTAFTITIAALNSAFATLFSSTRTFLFSLQVWLLAYSWVIFRHPPVCEAAGRGYSAPSDEQFRTSVRCVCNNLRRQTVRPSGDGAARARLAWVMHSVECLASSCEVALCCTCKHGGI